MHVILDRSAQIGATLTTCLPATFLQSFTALSRTFKDITPSLTYIAWRPLANEAGMVDIAKSDHNKCTKIGMVAYEPNIS